MTVSSVRLITALGARSVLCGLLLFGFARTAEAQWTTNGSNINNTNTGNVGIGTTTPAQKLDVNGNALISGAVAIGGSTLPGTLAVNGRIAINNSSDFEIYGSGAVNGFNIFSEGGLVFLAGANQRLHFGSNNVNSQVVLNEGRLGIGTEWPQSHLHVVGDVTVSGNIAAKYQDVAEWVPAQRSYPAGTVLVLDTDRINHVRPAGDAYDTHVAGVVTDLPGLLLGEAGDDKVKVATTGRVKVKVDASEKPVHVGDLLVTGTKPGTAMVSEPMEINGRKFHQPGTILGKALEPLQAGEGEILVLLSLQ